MTLSASPAQPTSGQPTLAGPADLSGPQRAALIARLTALADDEIILAQRDSEWTGHAPILEEDIALANMAQDELGHALLYLGLRTALDGSDPDRLTFFRSAREYTNAQLVELPRGDWARTMLRQYLYDAYEVLWLGAARRSTYAPLAEVAGQALREEKFHLQHTALWTERLGLGTPESARRMQEALELLWPYAAQLFVPTPGEAELVAAGIVPDLGAVQADWQALVTLYLHRCGLHVPDAPPVTFARTQHGEELLYLLSEMQSTAREYAAGSPTW